VTIKSINLNDGRSDMPVICSDSVAV